MRKSGKTLTTLILTIVLCTGLGFPAWAEESFLDFLASFAPETTGETPANEEAMPSNPNLNSYSVRDVTFSLPREIQFIEEVDGTLYYADDFDYPDKIVMVNYIDAQGEDIDLSKEKNQADLLKGMTGVGIDEADYMMTMIDNHRAMEVTYEQMEADITVYGRALVVELEDAVFVATIMSKTKLPDYELFDYLKYTTKIGGSASVENQDASSLIGRDEQDSRETGEDTASAIPIPEGTMDARPYDGNDIVLIDNDICRFVLTAFYVTDDEFKDFCIDYDLENKTGHELSFSLYNAFVNDFMMDYYIDYDDLAPGEKRTSTIEFWGDDLLENQITIPIEVGFQVALYDLVDREYVSDDTYYTILPFGGNVAPQPAPDLPAGSVSAVDNDVLRLVVTGMPELLAEEYVILPVYIENRTDKTISVHTKYGEDSSGIEGLEFNTVLGCEIAPGKKVNSHISWAREDLDEAGITYETMRDITLDYAVTEITDLDRMDYTPLDEGCVTIPLR